MRTRFFQRLGLAVIVALLCAALPTARAFDTGWHTVCTDAVAEQRAFKPYARDILQIGTWGPDFFSILYQNLLGARMEQMQAQAKFAMIPGLRQLFLTANKDDVNRAAVRKVAIYMHFDNIRGDLNTNAKFHFLHTRLLENTISLLNETALDSSLKPDERNAIVLLALGSSLHMVQDFYSHSNWTHIDFVKVGMPDHNLKRVPTYWEAVGFFGMRDAYTPAFPFTVQSGVYPMPASQALTEEGVPMIHECMHHDNTQCMSVVSGELRDMKRYHRNGLVSAEVDSNEHVMVAVETASAASLAWVRLLCENPQIEPVITEAAAMSQPKLVLQNDAQASVTALGRASVLVNKWDGPTPGKSQKKQAYELRLTTSRVLLSLMRGSVEILPNPFNRFWTLYVRHNVTERLTEGFSSLTTDAYVFPPEINAIVESKVPPDNKSPVPDSLPVQGGLTAPDTSPIDPTPPVMEALPQQTPRVEEAPSTDSAPPP